MSVFVSKAAPLFRITGHTRAAFYKTKQPQEFYPTFFAILTVIVNLSLGPLGPQVRIKLEAQKRP